MTVTPDPREVLFEFVRVGSSVRVSAIDPRSNTEAVVVGPATAGEARLRQIAMAKLRFLLSKQAGP